MSDQSRVDKMIEKYLHFWSLLLAACGRIWDKVKTDAGKAAALMCRCADWIADTVEKGCNVAAAWVRKALGMLAAWLLKARKWVMRRVKPVLRKIASWLLKIRQMLQPGIRKVGGWFAAAGAWLAAQAAKLPKPKARELPPVEEAAAQPETGEATVIPAPAPAEAVAQPAVSEPEEEEPEQQKEPRIRITNPTLAKILAVLGVIGKYVKLVIKWIWKLRTIFMAVPVVWAAVKLAMENMDRLPDRVGLDIQSTGEFAHMITKTEAVFWPLGLTAFCLVLMFCSKKPLLPWVISIFTLVLPVLIWVLNYYA